MRAGGGVGQTPSARCSEAAGASVLAVKVPVSTTRERNLFDMVSLLKSHRNRWRFG
jgi:hypothetical protein